MGSGQFRLGVVGEAWVAGVSVGPTSDWWRVTHTGLASHSQGLAPPRFLSWVRGGTDPFPREARHPLLSREGESFQTLAATLPLPWPPQA